MTDPDKLIEKTAALATPLGGSAAIWSWFADATNVIEAVGIWLGTCLAILGILAWFMTHGKSFSEYREWKKNRKSN